jgi:hypothetical protein
MCGIYAKMDNETIGEMFNETIGEMFNETNSKRNKKTNLNLLCPRKTMDRNTSHVMYSCQRELRRSYTRGKNALALTSDPYAPCQMA